MSSPPIRNVEIGDTFGALFIGALVAMAIYGITTLQAYFYYMSFPKDDIAIKLLVGSIWFLDTLHVVCMCHSLHYYLIVGFGKPQVLISGTWPLFISVGINVTISFIAQCFFAARIFKLCPPRQRWWVTSIIGITILAHIAFGIETVALLFIKKEFRRLKEASITAGLPFGITSIVSDVLIAGALCVLLGRKRSAFEDTNSIVNGIIIFAINRCILTSAVAVAETIVFSVLPNSFYSMAIDFVIGKLYSNSLLAVLNSRTTLRRNSRGDGLEFMELPTSFHTASAVQAHQIVLNQARTRESRVLDTGKDNRHMTATESSPSPTAMKNETLSENSHA